MGSTKGEQKLPSVRSRKAGTLRKLGLLMWKNLLLRKRHWLLTLFEIIVPTFLFTLMVSIRVLPDSAFKPVQVKHNSTFKTIDENTIRKNFCNNYGIWGDSSNLTSLTSAINLTLSIHDCYVLPEWIAEQFELEELLGTRKLFYGPEGNWTKKAVTYLAEKMGSQIVIPGYNYTINADFTDYMEPVADNIELDAKVNQLYFQTNDSLFNFFIGVYFNLPDDYDVTSEDPPSQLDYDIRTQNFWFSDFVYPYLQIPGPRNYSLFDGGFIGNYNRDGFTYIQTLIDRFYISSVVNDEDILSKFELQSNMYPYPPYNQDNGMSQLYGAFLPTVAVLSFVLLCPSLIKNVVYEKETGVRELVRLMGLDSWLVWFGWFLHAFLTIIVTSTIIVFFLKAQLVSSAGGGYFPPILISTDGFFLWVLLILYGISSIAFCMAISTFFSKPTLATTLGIAAWLVSYFIPRGILEYQYDVIGLAPKLASCLLPNMCITWAFRIISMFEGRCK